MLSDLCRPFVRETKYHKWLHFSLEAVQSQMLKRSPNTLVTDYTRTMMGFLMFDIPIDRIAILGLGGGSLAKFCYRELPRSRIDVVEINPYVIALRDEFHVPADDERFEVHLDDAARFVSQSAGQFDVLLVDAYTRDGIPPRLASQAFYDACRGALSERGVMVSNLYCENADGYIDRIRRSFDGSLLVVDEDTDVNQVIFASAGGLPMRTPRALDLPPAQLRASAWFLLRPTFSRIASAMERHSRLQRQAPEAG